MGRDRQGRPKNKRSKKELGGEIREIYKESERARRGLDLREPFLEAPPARKLIRKPVFSDRKNGSEFAKLVSLVESKCTTNGFCGNQLPWGVVNCYENTLNNKKNLAFEICRYVSFKEYRFTNSGV
ncbi:hypothetical protein TNCV_870211 [Trichonephila clavipes]|nr:hypothetical protein TNCV_870211 [Trichonephila clavipes]